VPEKKSKKKTTKNPYLPEDFSPVTQKPAK